MKKKRLKTLQILLSAFGAAAFGGGILIAPQAASQGVRDGLTLCGQVVIPSLFPFLALSSFLVQSGLAQRAGHLLEPITKLLFRLPGAAGSAILMSLIGGYPVGARMTVQLLDAALITQKQAQRMLFFCQFRPCLFNQRRWLRHAPQPTGRANPLRGTHCQRAADRALHALSRIQRDDERKPCCSPYRPVHGAGPGGRRYTRLRRHCIYLRLGHSIFLHCCAVQPSSAAQHTAYSFTMLFRGNLRLRQRSRKSAAARPCACARLGRNLRALPSAARCIQNKAFPAALFLRQGGKRLACLPDQRRAFPAVSL